jgi:hypothetical protein
VTEKVSDHVDAAPCISGVAAERVPELMRGDRPRQTRPPRRSSQQLPDRGRPHRRADRVAEQVHHHDGVST